MIQDCLSLYACTPEPASTEAECELFKEGVGQATDIGMMIRSLDVDSQGGGSESLSKF